MLSSKAKRLYKPIYESTDHSLKHSSGTNDASANMNNLRRQFCSISAQMRWTVVQQADRQMPGHYIPTAGWTEMRIETVTRPDQFQIHYSKLTQPSNLCRGTLTIIDRFHYQSNNSMDIQHISLP